MAVSDASHVEVRKIITDEPPGDAKPGAECHVAGMEEALRELRELVAWPILYSAEAVQLGLQVFES